jgi:hypothetical protein
MNQFEGWPREALCDCGQAPRGCCGKCCKGCSTDTPGASLVEDAVRDDQQAAEAPCAE